jgi:hypothetical protein
MKYKLELIIEDIDANMHTVGVASVFIDVAADDYSTAYQLGTKLSEKFGADYFVLNELE